MTTPQQRSEIWLNAYKDYIAFHADIKDSNSLALEAADRLLKEFDQRFNKIVIEPKYAPNRIELKGGQTLSMEEAKLALDEAFECIETIETNRKATNWINTYYPLYS